MSGAGRPGEVEPAKQLGVAVGLFAEAEARQQLGPVLVAVQDLKIRREADVSSVSAENRVSESVDGLGNDPMHRASDSCAQPRLELVGGPRRVGDHEYAGTLGSGVVDEALGPPRQDLGLARTRGGSRHKSLGVAVDYSTLLLSQREVESRAS